LTVAKHRVAVRDLAHLFQKVADVNDADPVTAQAPDQSKQMRDIITLKTARGLVHQDDVSLRGERAADLNHLPGCDREVSDATVRAYVRVMKIFEDCEGLAPCCFAIEPAPTRRLETPENVLHHGQVWSQ